MSRTVVVPLAHLVDVYGREVRVWSASYLSEYGILYIAPNHRPLDLFTQSSNDQ